MERPIVTREAAASAGLIRYFLGSPCRNGHLEERYVHNGGCVQCGRDRKAKREKLYPERFRAKRKRKPSTPEARAKRAEYKRARNIRLRGNGVIITPDELFCLRARYGKRCAICQDKGALTIDHIIPLKAGGRHEARNIQFLCHPCNSSKGARPMEDFARSRGLLL